MLFIISHSHASPRSRFYLDQLSDRHSTFPSLRDLITAISHTHDHAVERKHEIMEHIQHPRCKLFGNVAGGVRVTMSDVEKLYVEGEAGSDTLVSICTDSHIDTECAPMYAHANS